MSSGKDLGHVDRGVKADRVRATTLKELVRGGPLLQNTLINKVAKEVAKDLEDIDANTVSGLVRKFLKRHKGALVEVRVDEKPRRKYWEITLTGLQEAFHEELVNLHEFAKAYVRIKPGVPEGALICYKALARSEALSLKVDVDIKKQGERLLTKISFLENHLLTITIPITFVWEFGLTIFFSVIYHLVNDEDLRRQVGPEITKELCVSVRTLLDSLEADVKETRKMVDALHLVQE
jgi:hypothetical protein